MAVYRQVHVDFWQDGFVLDLTPEEKYFYLYLMTNSKTTQCGIYELPLRVIEMETGYNRETVEKLLNRFVDYGKIQYDPNTKEIYMVNWAKYNFTKSPKVISRIKQELLSVKNKSFQNHVLDYLEKQGLANKRLYRMANKTEIPQTLADEIFERDKRCVRCGASDDLTIDHIFPRNIGGTNTKDNLRVLCRSCNSKRPTIGAGLEEDLALDGLTLDDFEKVCGVKLENPYPIENQLIPYRQKEEEKEEEQEKEQQKEQQEKEQEKNKKDRSPKPSQKPVRENLCSIEDIKTYVESQMASNPLPVKHDLLVDYINCLRLYRKTARISTNVVKTEWEKWTKYPQAVLTHAMWTHIEKHDDKSEDYTFGIMRNTNEPKAKRELIVLINRARSKGDEEWMKYVDTTTVEESDIRSGKDQGSYPESESGQGYYDQPIYNGLFAK